MKLKIIKNISKEKFISVSKESYCRSEIARKLGIAYTNGSVSREIDYLIQKYEVNIDHFDYGRKRRKHKKIKKKCPVCNKIFDTYTSGSNYTVTCSYACSNTYFRSGKNNGQYKHGNMAYQNICFIEHGKKCIVCGESNVVAAHHVDFNHKNDDPKNLVPLCPTHHCYVHTNAYKDEIQVIIEKYLAEKYQ